MSVTDGPVVEPGKTDGGVIPSIVTASEGTNNKAFTFSLKVSAQMVKLGQLIES